MDPLIEDYIAEVYHPDMVDTIKRAFRLMDNFGMEDYQSDFINLLMAEEQMEPQNIQDQFFSMLINKLRVIENAHTVVISPEIALFERVELLDGLYTIQHLNDYSIVAHALESDLDPEEKISEALAHCCGLTADRIVSYIEHIDPTVVTRLQAFISERERLSGQSLTTFTDLQMKIINNLRKFKAFCAKENIEHAMGVRLIETNMLTAQPLEHYMPFVKEALEHDNVRQLAIDIFSLLLMTEEGYDTPLIAYHKHSGLFFENIDLISKVDSVMIWLSGQFEAFKSHSDVVKDQS